MWWTNKAMWGSVFMIAALVASFFGLQISEAEQGQLVDTTVAAIEAVVGLVGLVMMIIDRIQAHKKIKGLERRLMERR